MDGRKHRARPLAAIGVVAVMLVAAACTGGQSGGDEKSVTVVGTWGGSEQESFLAMVKPWEERTGNTVKYTVVAYFGVYLGDATRHWLGWVG